jgi:hypothetical protein
MKKLLLILTFFVNYTFATTYYISPTGADSNPGTILQPFKTWERISSPRWSNILQPGDIVYIRGGNYTSPHANDGVSEAVYWSGINGTSSNYITIQAYPGEYPVLNCSNMTDANSSWPDKYILYMSNCSYLKIKGLHLTTIRQIQDGSGVSRGLYMTGCNFVTLEQIEVDHCGCNGFSISYSDDITYINCDSHHNYDSLSSDAGDNADGFGRSSNPSTRTTYIGCRAWLNSDDGWDFIDNPGTAIINNCWSFANGYGPYGNGEGFKLGFAGAGQSGLIGKVLNNCLAFNNKDAGFNNNGDPQCRYQLYNCVAYKNGAVGFEFGYGSGEVNTFKNNISYQNTGGAIRYSGANTNNSNNTWNGLVTVTNADFVSIDSTGMSGARQSDGSLPILNYLRLSTGSDLINAGINVGLPYVGSAPDMGAFETGTVSPPVAPLPTANAGADQSITLPTTSATLIGIGTGGGISYLWTALNGGILTTSTSTSTGVTGLTTAGIYRFVYRVTDSVSNVARDTVQITVNGGGAPTYVPTGVLIRSVTLNATRQGILSWTANVTDNSSAFTVQRRNCGDYVTLSTVPAVKGVSSYTGTYNLYTTGYTTFRIVPVDKQGTPAISNIAEVKKN